MALPRFLKKFNVVIEGSAFFGQVKTVTLPSLELTAEDFRPGGLDAPLVIDLGMEALKLEHTYGGDMYEIYGQFGLPGVSALNVRFSGSQEREDDGGIDEIEIIMRGRHTVIDGGDAEAGSLNETKVTTALSYYKRSVNGKAIVEIDIPGCKRIINGVDLLAAHRRAMKI